MNFSEIENVGLQSCSQQHSSSTPQLQLVSGSYSIIMLDFTITQQLIAAFTNSSSHSIWFCAWHWPFVLFCQKFRRQIPKLVSSKQQSFLGMWCISHGLQWHQVLTENAMLQLQISSMERILMQTTKIMTLKVSLKIRSWGMLALILVITGYDSQSIFGLVVFFIAVLYSSLRNSSQVFH